MHRALGLDDVLLDGRPRRVRPVHVLGEIGRVVLLAAVPMRRRLEHHLAHRRLRAAAGGQDVHRPDHVVLVREPGRGGGRVDHQARVDDGVDLGRLDDPAQQRVLVPHPHVFGALELDGRVVGVDADDRLDVGLAFERLGDPAAPVRREAGDEDAAGVHPNQIDRRLASIP
jgi:hypothetical protein